MRAAALVEEAAVRQAALHDRQTDLEAAGWVVGAPGVADRATMHAVMFAGNLGAALAGGASMGLALHRNAR